MATGHHTRAARRALRLDVEVEQLRALAREAVDVRRRRPAQQAAAVATHLAVAEVVHEDEQDVRIHCGAKLLPRHRNSEAFIGVDVVIGVLGVLA